jgi:hypothetical protein
MTDTAAVAPELDWRVYGAYGQAPVDQYAAGNLDVCAYVQRAMQASDAAWHLKRWSDGYGHVIHNWFAVGRPVFGFESYYRDQLAGPLWVEGVTSYNVEGRTPAEIAALLRELRDDEDKHNCGCARRRPPASARSSTSTRRPTRSGGCWRACCREDPRLRPRQRHGLRGRHRATVGALHRRRARRPGDRRQPSRRADQGTARRARLAGRHRGPALRRQRQLGRDRRLLLDLARPLRRLAARAGARHRRHVGPLRAPAAGRHQRRLEVGAGLPLLPDRGRQPAARLARGLEALHAGRDERLRGAGDRRVHGPSRSAASTTASTPSASGLSR